MSDPAPVFVIGSPRSGTSALGWSLAQHPRFATGPESDFLYYFCRSSIENDVYSRSVEHKGSWLDFHDVSLSEFMRFLGVGIDALFRAKTGNTRWVDATPSNTSVAEQLATMFPAAKFVHVIRDGRAVVASMRASGFDSPFARDFEAACRSWDHYVSLGLKFTDEYPERSYEVRQESLLERPQQTLDPLFGWLGEAPSQEAVAFLRQGRVNSSFGRDHDPDIRAVKDHRVMPESPWDNWSKDERKTFRHIAGASQQKLGYLDG